MCPDLEARVGELRLSETTPTEGDVILRIDWGRSYQTTFPQIFLLLLSRYATESRYLPQTAVWFYGGYFTEVVLPRASLLIHKSIVPWCYVCTRTGYEI